MCSCRIRVDPRDGRADAAVGVAHVIAEEIGQQDHERQRRKRGQRQPVIQVETASRPARRASRNRSAWPRRRRQTGRSARPRRLWRASPGGPPDCGRKSSWASRCRCSKISLRRSYIVSWPTHCMMRTCAYCSPKLASNGDDEDADHPEQAGNRTCARRWCAQSRE